MTQSNRLVFSDGKVSLALPLAPENITQSVVADYARNSPLNTYAPHVRPKSTATTLSFSKILLISPSHTVNQQPTISQLEVWTKGQDRLKCTYNTLSFSLCYISSLKIEYIQWRNGKPTHANIDLEVIEVAPEVRVKKTISTKKITPREQQTKKKTVEDKLKQKRPNNLRGDLKVEVSDLATVSITSADGTFDYDYEDFISGLS